MSRFSVLGRAAAALDRASKHLRHCFAVPDAGFWTGLVQQAVSGTLR